VQSNTTTPMKEHSRRGLLPLLTGHREAHRGSESSTDGEGRYLGSA
jgi:hypothetical protein